MTYKDGDKCPECDEGILEAHDCDCEFCEILEVNCQSCNFGETLS